MNAVVRTLSAFWHLVAAALDPILYVLVGLPGRLHPIVGLVPVSVLVGAVMIVVFKLVSNQDLIRALRDRMKGHLLGAIVFGHSFRMVVRCLGRAVGLNGRYLVHAFLPLLIMALPVIVLYVQLQHWYSWRPPGLNEACLVTASYRGAAPDAVDLRFPPNGGQWQVNAGFVFPSAHSVVWRLRPESESDASLFIDAGGREFGKTLVGGTNLFAPLSPMRTDGSRLLPGFLYPREPLLPAGTAIQSISVAYPSRRSPAHRWYTHWVVWFFGLTIAAGLLWSRVFGVTL